jgi:hypothetical protein
MCGKPGKGRHITMPKPYIKYKIISSSRSWEICYENVNGRTDKRTDKRTDGRTRWLQYSPHSMSGGIISWLRCHMWIRNCFPFWSTWAHLQFIVGFVLPDLYLYFCPLFYWPLYCLSFFDLQFLFTPFVSSNFSLL